MRFYIVLLGVLICLAAQGAGKQGVPTNRPVSRAQQSLTCCIDEQDGRYVLLDDKMIEIAGLQSAGADDEVFARHLGYKVQVRGNRSSGPGGTFTVTAIEQVAGRCGQAK